MNKEAPFKIKIILSYLIPLLAGGFIAWHIASRIIPLIKIDEERDPVFDKAILTGTTLSALYETELLCMVLVQDPIKENYDNYDSTVNKVYDNLDSLIRITGSPLQRDILSRLLELMDMKEENLIEIMRQIDKDKEQKLLKQNLSSILKPAKIEPPPPIAVIRERIEYDSLPLVTKEKKNIWKRIADVFTAPAPDTILHPKVTQVYKKDTIYAPVVTNHYDTVINTIEKIYGEKMRNQNVISKRLQDLIATDKTINQEMNILLDELQKEALELTYRDISSKEESLRESGELILAVGLLSIFIIILFIIFIFIDLNKSKAYRKELEIARIKAEEMMQVREKLLLTISHDIKAPLSSISGYIELLNSSDLNEKDRGYINSMSHSIRHVMELLSNLLEYSRLEASKTVLVPEKFQLNPIFEELISSFYPIARKKGLNLKLANSITADLWVEMDRTRMQQILTNLLSNALKFTDNGEVILTVSKDKDQEGTEWLNFLISDTGCGIPEENTNFIFEEYSQINGTNRGGSGFGLFIVKRLIDLFKGTITVTPNNPVGTVFTVRIPLNIVWQQDPDNYIKTAHSQAMKNILVIDDELPQLVLIEMILNNMGHSAVTVTSIEKALEQLKGKHFDLVITDIRINNTTGFQLLEALRNSGSRYLKELPVIAESANEEYDNNYFIEKGFSGFIRKPFTINQFKQTLNNVLKPSRMYNLDDLKEIMNGDPNALKQILKLYISSVKESTEYIIADWQNGAFDKVKNAAHKLLPIYRQLKINELANIASFIELSDENDIAGIEEKLSYMVYQSKIIFAELEQYCQS